jgi:hypothetical protein
MENAGRKFRVPEKRYSICKPLSLPVIMAKPEASKVIAYKLSGIYKNSHIILGTVLHVIDQRVEKFIHFAKILKHAILRSVCTTAEATIRFIMSVCTSTACP